jgi:hypothetical protein
MREASHAARDWLRRVRRAERQLFRAASVAADEYRIRYELTACLNSKIQRGFCRNGSNSTKSWVSSTSISTTITVLDAYLGALTPYREEGLSRKVTSIVLNIIGTKHAGLHFLMTMNFFFRATGEQMLERFCVDTNHILRWLYIGWCLDHPGACAVPKDSFWKTTCIVSRMSPQLLKASLIPVASRPQGVRITGFTKTMSSARMKKSDQ